MLPPARVRKRGVSDTLDANKRIHKHVDNSGREQLSAVTITRSASKIIAVMFSIATPQGSQAVLPLSSLSHTNMVVDDLPCPSGHSEIPLQPPQKDLP
ncbi:BgTH12-04801 [Blumeria graminis f. sp. triticale]|uniref:BgTH12-04801 n=1 Tax=Blumeria graminis f. sp. triticale TaxID=1689686 RepID=A0A9W4GB42_BLUGR|nr:BgTH12-04801 [Blumeria graminis f. sp. triticale]